MAMLFNTSLTPLLLVISLAFISALAESDSCQCNHRTRGYGGRVCSDGTTPSNLKRDQTFARHNQWGLYGDCLPQVEANTVKCFRWKTRACSHVSDICEYSSRRNFNSAIMTTSDSAVLLSPNHDNLVSSEDQTFGHHFFCVYNVSLSCPRNSVVIQPTARTNWPRQQDTSCVRSEAGCNNYVAFYADSNSNTISREFYGQRDYRHSLDSSSFLAVMWTDTVRNEGIFEFNARCNDQDTFLSTTSTAAVEGSGNGDILSVQEN